MPVSRRSLLKAIPGAIIFGGIFGTHYWLYPLVEQRVYRARDLARRAEHYLVPERPVWADHILNESLVGHAAWHLDNLRDEHHIVRLAHHYFNEPVTFIPKPGFTTLDRLKSLYLPRRCKPAFVIQKSQPLQEMEIIPDYGKWLNWLGILEPTMKVMETPHPVEIERFCYNGHLDFEINDRADDIHELCLLYDSKPGQKVHVNGKWSSRQEEISGLLNEKVKKQKPFNTIGLYAADCRGNAAVAMGKA